MQLSRFVALSLINEINAGSESAAWMYPAYLDLFAVVFAPPLIWAIMKKPGVLTWASAVVYLAISIVNHMGNVVTTGLVGPPSIVPEGMSPLLVPVIQTVLDVVFLVLLLVPRFRHVFFRISEE